MSIKLLVSPCRPAFIVRKMILFTLLLSCLLLSANGGRFSRMTGGNVAPDHKYPYLVSFRQSELNDPNDYYHFCSGSIINERWILTAASCFDRGRDPSVAWAVVGTNNFFDGGDKYKIKKVVHHEKYAYRYHDNIALVRIVGDIQFGKNVKSISLPTKDFTSYNVLGKFAGWATVDGSMISDKLQEVDLPIISNAECRESRHSYVTDKHLCTYYNSSVGLCYEDIGGPLVIDDVQIGLASYAIPCAFDWPDVYTKVFSYLDWIAGTVEKFSEL